MTGVIDVGGGLRGIFGAGVFDYCMENGIHFDYCVGISAGSANIASYLSSQKGRNYQFYMEYSFRRRYMSIGNVIRMGSYIDMDYIYGVLSNHGGENPLDYESFRHSPAVMKVVALNALTGEAAYFDKSDMLEDDYRILKASSSLPIICRPYRIDGVPYYDGGIADPIPLKMAYDDGCEKVVVILTRPRDFVRRQEKDLRMARLLKRRYPKAAKSLLMRYKKYNDGVAFAKEHEARGDALLLAPDDLCGMRTLTKSKSSMEAMYQKGYESARAIGDFL